AAEDSGNSLDQITTAISMMQRKLAGGDAGAVAALNELHLSLVELKNLSPDRQFIEIADAIAKIQDPAERTRLAVEIFGRAGAAVLPTLRADIKSIADQTAVMSETSVRAWDALGDAIARAARTTKAVVGDLIA